MDKYGKVAIIGGGIAGLTAAHILAAQGFDVTIIEADPEIGGQARSKYTQKNRHCCKDSKVVRTHGRRNYFMGSSLV